MNDSWVNLFYFFMSGAALLLGALGLWFTAIMPGFDRWIKRFFLSYFIVIIICSLVGTVEVILGYLPVSASIMYFTLWLESLTLSLPWPMLMIYLLHDSGESIKSSKLFKAVICLWLCYVAVHLIFPFNKLVSYITPEKVFVRELLYPLLPLPLIAIMLLNLAGTIKFKDRFSRNTFISLIIAIVPLTAVLCVQIFTDVFPLIDIAMGMSALSMYGLIMSEQIKLELNHQQEIANQKASIMVLQMRPHFIYNTMTSIYCLCSQDPKLARQVILDFTAYLRKNFTAIASSTPIPFKSELEHTRAYLAVEQAQYSDSLFVDYDIQHTYFRLPPLTLQPIVENSVKHGRDPYAGVLHISIKTRKTDKASEIIVADDGRGLQSVESDGGKAHIALQNIKERLEMMCNGSLIIKPNDGGGTVVIVNIPDN